MLFSKKNYITFGRPSIGLSESINVARVIKSGWIGTGPKTAAFENIFASRYKVQSALALNSCTAALQLACEILEDDSRNEIIVPAITFCATASSVILSGFIPKIVDVDPKTKCMSLESIQDAISSNTKAIIYVHMAGYPSSEIIKIAEYCRNNNIALIEDCAHAIETEITGQKAGTFGDISCFSFYATKNITTAEGGMLVANDPTYINKAKVLALHGMTKDAWKRFSDSGYKHYDVICPGKKMNMTDLAAAIGLSQYKKLDKMHSKRKIIWNKYQKNLSSISHFITLPSNYDPNNQHSHHLYTIEVHNLEHRDELLMHLHRDGIGSGVHYRSISQLSYYKDNDIYYANKQKPIIAESIGLRTLSLPLMPSLTNSEQSRILKSVHSFFAGKS